MNRKEVALLLDRKLVEIAGILKARAGQLHALDVRIAGLTERVRLLRAHVT